MFSPSQEDVRRFFCETFTNARQGKPLQAIETIAARWMDEHPEYHAELAKLNTALASMKTVQDWRANPFLHLSMHLSLSEQCSIDQPRGIRQAIELLAYKRNSLHQAHHEAMECLGKMMWESQLSGKPPDGDSYLACIQRRATRD